MAELGTYNFDVSYKPGRLDSNADVLSWCPSQVSCSTVQALLAQGRVNVDCLAVHLMKISGVWVCLLCHWVWSGLKNRGKILSLPQFVIWSEVDRSQPRSKGPSVTLRCWSSWMSGQGWSLIRMFSTGNESTPMERKFWQLLCLQQLCNVVGKFLNDHVGHLGKDMIIALCQERFHWPGMNTVLVKWISKYSRCTCANAPSLPHCAPLENITSQPMEMVALDYLTLEDGRGGVANVLVITDHFSKYAVAIPTTNQTARTTARIFFDTFIIHYGFPTRNHSDQGRNFESRIIKELCAMAGMKNPVWPHTPNAKQVYWTIHQDLDFYAEDPGKRAKLELEKIGPTTSACIQLHPTPHHWSESLFPDVWSPT